MKLKLHIVHLMLMVFLLPLVAAARDKHAHPSADISAAISTSAVHAGDQAMVAVTVNVHAGLHAQSHTPVDEYAIKFVLSGDANPLVKFGEVQYPAATEKTFELLGKLSVYEGKTVVLLPITIAADAKPGDLKITGQVTYQACNDRQCFNPENPVFSVETKIVPADQAVSTAAGFPVVTAPTSTGGFDLQNSGWPLVFGIAFLIGIIFNLMPCVLPVLPLKIMGFYEVSQHNRGKSIALGAVFSAGLIASFGVLAALVVGSTKLQWGGLFQHTWFTITISLVLVIMAISTFGFFTVNVPNSLYAFTPRHDTYIGNFLFGILTAALSTPCTFGMFVGLLAWAISKPAWLGGASIVMVGVGMAFPYFVLSAVPEVARKLPRTGPWAEVIKQMMGFLLLATAVYFAQPLFGHVSKQAFWWAMFAVIAAGGIFLVVRTFQLSKVLMPRAIAVAMALLVVGPAFGVVHRITWEPFDWIPYSDEALATAKASGNPVLIDFTADWCGNCHYLEAKVLHNSKIVGDIRNRKVIMIKADVTAEDASARPLLSKLTTASAIPLTAVYNPNQNQPQLLNGIYTADDLLHTLAGSTP